MNDPRIAEDVLEFKRQYVEFLREHVHVPEEIARKYTVESLLSESKRSRVFLMIGRETESQVILKVFDTPAGAEAEPILRRLHHPAIPKFMEMHWADGKTYLVREYFAGRSLAEILQAEGRLPSPEACAIAMQVCDVLSYLHSRKKPVIYRDIKAENIIITKEQRVKLIDFDISREYNEAAGSDTAYYGTRAYSPPEQFGYAQTDARTDVYSLGVLLLFMLTGSRKKEGVAGVKAPYRHILEKCLAFAPKDRYPSAAALQKALDKAERRPGTLRVRSAVLLALAALVLGVGAGMYAERQLAPPAAIQAEEAAVFSSPLIEQAVRLALGKAENEPVYPYELQGVTGLFLCGDQAFDGSQRLLLEYVAGKTELSLYLDSYGGESITVQKGSLASLQDLAQMTNLRRLDVMFENVSDLTPLENLPIERLQLAGNNITDLTPLASLPLLTYLNLDGNPVLDIAPLSQLTRLEVLDASETYIHDLTPLSGLQSLNTLYINNAKITDVTPLAGLNLVKCFLQGNEITDITPLAGVAELLY